MPKTLIPLRLSIITPTSNAGNYLAETIESVGAARVAGVEVEHQIRDNCSTDGTEKILEAHAGQVRVVRERDGGQADAVNRGWNEATGDWLAWLNADDLYEPGALAAVADCIRANPAARWIVGAFRIVNAAGAPVGRLHSGYKNFLLRHYSYPLLLSENIIPQMSVFIRRDLWEEAGPLRTDDPLAFDYEYWLRLGKICPPCVIPQCLSVFRWHADSKTAQGLHRQFASGLAYARAYAGPGLRWTVGLHRINYWKTLAFYRLVKSF